MSELTELLIRKLALKDVELAEARIDELRPLQASVDRDDLLLLIEERLAKLDRSKQLKENNDV